MFKIDDSFFTNGLIVLETNIEGKYIFHKIIEQKNLNSYNCLLLENDILMDETKSINDLLSKKSEDRFFVLIDKAHKLNKSCINALLKTTEDLYEKTTVVLVTNYKSFLLKTILSRSLQFKLNYQLDTQIDGTDFLQNKFNSIDIMKNGTEYPIEIIQKHKSEVEEILQFLFTSDIAINNKIRDIDFFKNLNIMILKSIPLMLCYILKIFIENFQLQYKDICKIKNTINILSDCIEFNLKDTMILISIFEEVKETFSFAIK